MHRRREATSAGQQNPDPGKPKACVAQLPWLIRDCPSGHAGFTVTSTAQRLRSYTNPTTTPCRALQRPPMRPRNQGRWPITHPVPRSLRVAPNPPPGRGARRASRSALRPRSPARGAAGAPRSHRPSPPPAPAAAGAPGQQPGSARGQAAADARTEHLQASARARQPFRAQHRAAAPARARAAPPLWPWPPASLALPPSPQTVPQAVERGPGWLPRALPRFAAAAPSPAAACCSWPQMPPSSSQAGHEHQNSGRAPQTLGSPVRHPLHGSSCSRGVPLEPWLS
mmetsp:Transcript_107588/g.304287  ORF Transcript_107588/g.304287 Transcript_107588/m.304287 type:complete len:283 (-) Transcript_107588:671-1519(-)